MSAACTIEILKQGPRLHIEAAKRTSDINEAYLMVHNVIALAMRQTALTAQAQAECANHNADLRCSIAH